MQDYGVRHTDLAVKRAEWRLSRVYHQAEKDIDEKLKAWQKGHQRLEAMYRKQLAEGKITQADFDAWMRGQVFQGKQWQARKEQIQQTLLQADTTAANIINEGKLGVFATNANYIGYDLEHSANINTGFTLYDEQTVARLVKSDPKLLPPAKVKKDKAFTYYNKLVNQSVTLGIIEGESIRQIAKRIATTTGEKTYSSAVRNARTAYGGAQNAGRIEGMHQAQGLGIKVKKKWMATLDSKTRDAHADLDGQIQEVDDPFKSELGDIMYPLDPTAAPGNVYNCRCTVIEVFPDYPSDMQRRDNETGEIVGDMTYREWEAMKRGESKEKPDKTDYTGRTTDCYSAEHKKAISYIVKITTGPARDIWDKMVHDLDAPIQDTKAGEAYFRALDGVHFNANEVAKGDSIHAPYQNHFHEYFHNIDYKLGTGYGYLSTQYTDPATGKTLDKMLGDESLAAVKKFFGENLEKIGLGGYTYSEAMKEPWTAKMVMNGFARDVKSKYSLLDRSDISDMFERFFVTHHGRSYPFGAGHGTTYAKTKGARAKEAFAEMADATFANPGALAAIKDYFPESYRMWEDMLKGALT